MSNIVNCWSCHSQTNASHFFCSKCKIVQPQQAGLSPFKILDIKEAFNIDEKNLKKQYFLYQGFLHPDRFIGKTAREKMFASQQSMAINDAYNLLKSPINRADYLCVTLGGASYKDEKKTNISQDILMNSMMQREALSQANDKKALYHILDKNQKDQKSIIEEISLFYTSKDIHNLEKCILRLQYEIRFMQEIQSKIYKAVGKGA